MKLMEMIDRLIADKLYAYRYDSRGNLRTAYIHSRYDRLVCEYVDTDEQCDADYALEPYGTVPTVEDLTALDWEFIENVYELPDWKPVEVS